MSFCSRLALLALILAPATALAQAYPTKPVRLVIGFAAGGASDVFARVIAPLLTEQLGQPVIVENRPGAGGNIAADHVAKAAPDGHTVLFTSTNHYLTPFFFKGVPYDAQKDFVPIVNLANVPGILAAHPSVPANSVKELVEHAKRTGTKLFYGSVGTGTTFHLAGIVLAQVTGIDLEHVPYKGGNPAMNDALAGTLPLVILSATTVMPHARTGKLKALGLLEPQPTAVAPGVAPIAQSIPGYATADAWFGLLGPAGTPAPVVARINAEARKAVAGPEVRARLETLGFEVAADGSSEKFAAKIQQDLDMIRRVIAKAGIKPE